MVNNRLFIHTFVLLVLIGAADYICNIFYLYWTVSWVDMPMHFMAGGCVSMAFIWIYSNFFSLDKLSRFQTILIGLIASIVIGLLWEYFELHYGITSLSDGIAYYRDTASDLLMDVSGGILAGFYSLLLLPKKNNETVHNG